MSTQDMSQQSPVHFDRIGQIAIGVRDPARAKDFYQNILGMKLLFDAGGMSFFQCGEVRLMIGPSDASPSGATLLYFMVADIQQAHTALSERNVEFVQAPHLVARMPDRELWIAFLKDPDGNTLGVMSEVRRE
ncbi:MAG TPA: VOC family protein [Terracidiphilus sp.]|nr:VOC family protein [Terracidiphilus sp.]